jgi:hypothetical protein
MFSMTKSLPIPLATSNPNLTQEAQEERKKERKKDCYILMKVSCFFPLSKSQL